MGLIGPTLDQEREIVRLYVEEGLSQLQVAQRAFWAPSTIRNVLRRHGIKSRPAGINIQPRVAPNRIFRTSEQSRRVAHMYRDGISMIRIAETLGCSENAVRRELHRQGIQARSKHEACRLGKIYPIARAGADALTSRQRKVLGVLERLGPRTTPQIARLTGLSRDVAWEALDELAAMELVSRARGEGEGCGIGRPCVWRRTNVPLRDVLEVALEGRRPAARYVGDTQLPVGPFVAWVEDLIAREERGVLVHIRDDRRTGGGHTTGVPILEAVARRLGVPARMISRWKNEQQTIGLLTADEILTRANGPRLTDIWPHIEGVYSEAEAA